MKIMETLKRIIGKDVSIYLSGSYTKDEPDVIHECEIIEREGNIIFLGNEEQEISKIKEEKIENIDNTYIENELIIHLQGGLDLLIIATAA